MDFQTTYQEASKGRSRKYKSYLQDSLALHSFMLAYTSSYDNKKDDFAFKPLMPEASKYDRLLLCSMCFMEYSMDFEYILEDIKIEFGKQDQAYFEKLATSNEAEKVEEKIHNKIKQFRIDLCIYPKEAHKKTQLKKMTLVSKKEIFQSPFLAPVEDTDNAVYFWPNPDQENNINPRLANTFRRLISVDKRDTPLRFDNTCFGKVKKLDLSAQLYFTEILNSFRAQPVIYFCDLLHMQLRLISELYIYHSLVLDVQEKLKTNLTYKPSIMHAANAAEAVDRYAEIFKGPGYNVYKTVDLIRKIHAMVFDYDMNRFGEEAIRSAINKKGHNL